MGYFSQRAIMTDDCRSYRADGCHLFNENPLKMHLEALHDKLDELMDSYPHDPKHLGYDRYFYSDHIPELYEVPMTIQGVLRAIKIADREIERRKLREANQQRLISSILGSGETPDGQIVIIGIFLPITAEV